jgi:hypothetical protein
MLTQEARQSRWRHSFQKSARAFVARRATSAEELRGIFARIKVLCLASGRNKTADQACRRQSERSAPHSNLQMGNWQKGACLGEQI